MLTKGAVAGAREQGRRFCSREELSQGAREQERRFCSREELSQGAREQGRRFCSRRELSQGACEHGRRFCSRRELSQGAREQGRRFCSRRGRQRALSQEIIREITSGEKVSSMFLYSETSLVTQCWKRWFRPSSARMTLLLLEGRPAFRTAIFLSH